MIKLPQDASLHRSQLGGLRELSGNLPFHDFVVQKYTQVLWKLNRDIRFLCQETAALAGSNTVAMLSWHISITQNHTKYLQPV
jgi:hypothetical protein